MTDNQKASTALLCGSIGAVLTMAIHPTAATPHLGSGVAHGLALLSVLAMLLGTFGLTMALNAPNRLAIAAQTAYTLAAIAVLLAATVSGFVMPNLLRMMAHDPSASEPTWRIVIAAFFQINQAFSKLYSFGVALAICLWSTACLRQGRSKATAVYGIVSAVSIVLLLLAGHLQLNVHGMAVVMLSQVIWLVMMSVWLRAQPDARGNRAT